MDALALLCNLYGDGPATLKRLRTAGCASFDALGGLGVEDLAEILGTSQPAARRFLREARLLLERVDVRELEHEERPPLAAIDRNPPASAPEAAPVEDLTCPEPFAAEPPAETTPEAQLDGSTTQEDTDAPLIDQVLRTWRERDARVGAEHDVEYDDADEAVTVAEAEEEARAVGTPLRPRIVDGLDRGWCDRLRAHGISTLEALAGAEALELAQRISAGLTQLMRLQFLARRVLSERGQVETPEPPDMLRPVARPWPASQPTRPAPRRPEPVELIPGPHPTPRTKFSASEAPFGIAQSSLAQELDQAAGPAPRADEVPPPAPFEEGSGGPFAR
jgi:hypothetical protein